MIRLRAIDPGSEESGFVEYDPDAGTILDYGVFDNEILLARCWRERDPSEEHHLAIEMVDVFGMAGRTVFETCVWIGRFIEAWGAADYTRVTRHDVKMHLCHTKRSDDSMVRAALIARWGGHAVAIGGKGRGKDKTPRGPLHGIATHAWSALAVAVTWSDARRNGRSALALHPTPGGP
jgi:hypothetical protein